MLGTSVNTPHSLTLTTAHLGRHYDTVPHYDGLIDEETEALRSEVTKAAKLVINVKHSAHVGV